MLASCCCLEPTPTLSRMSLDAEREIFSFSLPRRETKFFAATSEFSSRIFLLSISGLLILSMKLLSIFCFISAKRSWKAGE